MGLSQVYFEGLFLEKVFFLFVIVDNANKKA